MATAYAKQRQQFGRAIGSFQAVKHLLAEAAVGLEVARAAVDAAAVTLDEALLHADIERAVASARVVASDAARAATRACVQVHGGMGYTWELPAHLLLKRVLVLDQTPTSAEGAVDQLVAALG
jgi:alkylation response protein AidB-like acyl-CoA dehydrogenase